MVLRIAIVGTVARCSALTGLWLAILLCIGATPGAAQQSGPAVAVSADQLDRHWPGLTPSQQFAVVEQLVQGADFATAERLLAATTYAQPNDRLIKDFYIGVIRKAQGRNGEATAIFRRLLDDHPEFDRVRLELADTLFRQQEDISARHHLDLMLGASASNPDLAATARSYINAIDSRRRWSLSSYVSIAPSTNLNQGGDNRVVYVNGLPFTIADRNLKKSGVGLAFGAQAGYSHPLTDRIDLIASAGGAFKRFGDSEFNDALVNVSVGPRYRFDWGYVGLHGIADRRWVADDNYYASWGGLASTLLRFSHRDLLFTDVTCSDRRFDHSWQSTDLSYQNGVACGLSSRWEHHFDTLTYVNALGGLGRERTGLEHLDNQNWFAGFGLHRELPWATSVYFQGIYTDKDYRGIYPTTTTARQDKRIDLSLNVTKRDLELFGLAPMLQYTYTINDSNVSLYRFDAHGVNLTLTKRY